MGIADPQGQQGFDGRAAVVQIGLEGLLDGEHHAARQVRGELVDGNEVGPVDLAQDLHRVGAGERGYARHELVQDRAEGPDVAALVGGAHVAELLRRHVHGGPEAHARAGATHVGGVGGLHDLGQPEVRDPGDGSSTGQIHHDVGRLEVAVHHPTLVGRVDALEHAAGQGVDVFRPEVATHDHVMQSDAVDVLHDQRRPAVQADQLDDGHHGGMHERGLRAAFADEAVVQVRHLGLEHLDRSSDAELDV